MESTGPVRGYMCRGHKCDQSAACDKAGRCLYQPSADIARAIMASQAVVREAEIIGVTQIVRKELQQTMPKDSAERKNIPLCSGVLDYFPAALAAVAKLSKLGNDKHNPGQPLHWARGKSTDHADCIARHLVDRGVIDPDTNLSHTVEVAWRALALLQEEEEGRGAPQARGAQ